MKIKIKYYDIPFDAGYFATPEFTSEEIVEIKNDKQLQDYIKTKRDLCGNSYKRKKSFGFDYISNQGAIKISRVKIKHL